MFKVFNKSYYYYHYYSIACYCIIISMNIYIFIFWMSLIDYYCGNDNKLRLVWVMIDDHWMIIYVET